MSWVFLTDRYAYKLKKPVRYAFLDYSTVELRRRNCAEEVRLNARLAAEVYCGLVPLTLGERAQLSVGGSGEIVDWLVQMRRLPEERMLDRALVARTATDADAVAIGRVLANFYRTAPVAAMSAPDYLRRLTAEISSNRRELARPAYLLGNEPLESVTAAQLRFLEREPGLLAERVHAARVVEAHGDLRPEHICLGRRPVIIDCLEFSRDLRTLDAASELAFLWLECERLGAADFGRLVFNTYCAESGDRVPASLLHFYKTWHACVRAKVAVWHLNDGEIDHPAKWIEKARHYLRLAAGTNAVEAASLPTPV